MSYSEQKISKEKCTNKESLILYLYNKHYDNVLNVNENQSISYHINKQGNLFASSDLYTEIEIYPDEVDELEEKENLDVYDLSNAEFLFKDLRDESKFTPLDKSKKLDYYLFKNLVWFLIHWYGEYGDKIFEIKENKFEWKIIWRLEC